MDEGSTLMHRFQWHRARKKVIDYIDYNISEKDNVA